MNELFVPYEESLQLKDLGFDEPCFGFYTEEYKSLIKNFCKYPINLPTKPFLAPTFSQAFKFFRDKYGLHHEVSFDSWNKETYSFSINQKKNKEFHYDDMTEYQSYEEAELACLRKLIKIVKDETN